MTTMMMVYLGMVLIGAAGMAVSAWKIRVGVENTRRHERGHFRHSGPSLVEMRGWLR
jgi:hypothetical protein